MTLGTDAQTLIKSLKCGRKAIQELQVRHYGTSEGAQRKQADRADPKKILYKNETTFTFDRYIPKLKEILNVLKKYGVSLYEEQMVNNILDYIMSPIIELKTEVNICR